MKIKIFGDSFADNKNTGSPEFFGSSWPSLLEKNKLFDVKNYAMAGSGTHWSFDKCIKNTHDCDKVIFVVSHYHRWFVSDTLRSKLSEMQQHIMAAGDLKPANKFHKRAMNTAKEFFLYFENREFEYNAIALYCNYLRSLFGKDLLILQGVSGPETKELNKSNLQLDTNNQLELIKISKHENDYIFLDKKYHPDVRKDMEYDARNCHLTHWHSQMLYEKIVNWIDTNEFSLTTDDLLELDKQEASRIYCKKWV